MITEAALLDGSAFECCIGRTWPFSWLSPSRGPDNPRSWPASKSDFLAPPLDHVSSVPSLVDFVDLLLTWIAGMQKPRGKAGRMSLITIRILVAGAGFEPAAFRL